MFTCYKFIERSSSGGTPVRLIEGKALGSGSSDSLQRVLSEEDRADEMDSYDSNGQKEEEEKEDSKQKETEKRKEEKSEEPDTTTTIDSTSTNEEASEQED